MRIFAFSLMGCFIFSLGSLADIGFPDIPEFREVSLAPEHIFVPQGFDSNDTSEVIVTGWYPNPCYEWSHATLDKKQDGVGISLKALVKQGLDMVCIAMAVPYLQSVKLGALPEGKTKLFVGSQESAIRISRANSNSVDDHIYAQVTHVRVEDRKILVIEAENPSDCVVLDHIESVYNGKDTCSVLPIMKQIKEVCDRNSQVSEYKFPIPKECLQAERVLFHVRSLEGKSMNFLLKQQR